MLIDYAITLDNNLISIIESIQKMFKMFSSVSNSKSTNSGYDLHYEDKSVESLSFKSSIGFNQLQDSVIDYLPKCSFSTVHIFKNPIIGKIPNQVFNFMSSLHEKYPVQQNNFLHEVLGIDAKEVALFEYQIVLEGQREAKKILLLMNYQPNELEFQLKTLAPDAIKEFKLGEIAGRNKANSKQKQKCKQFSNGIQQNIEGSVIIKFLQEFFNEKNPPRFNLVNKNSGCFVAHFLSQVWKVQSKYKLPNIKSQQPDKNIGKQKQAN